MLGPIMEGELWIYHLKSISNYTNTGTDHLDLLSPLASWSQVIIIVSVKKRQRGNKGAALQAYHFFRLDVYLDLMSR